MHLGDLVLRHVAGDTVLPADRTGPAGVLARRRKPRLDVTGQAARIVGGGLADERPVRVVTRGTRNARVAFAPAPARLKAIGLGPEGRHALLARQLHVPEGRVTGAAEVDPIR